MRLGRVVGEVVATRKNPRMEGFKILVVEDAEADGSSGSDYVVALDAVGAGLGELVFTVAGSSSREDPRTRQAATDTTIVGIVDRTTWGGETAYDKREDAGCI